MEKIVNGTSGGRHIAGAPLTTTATATAAPGLLRNAIDERIVRVRPMATPLDQLSRCAGARQVGAMTVEYYCVDTKKTESTCAAVVNADSLIHRGDALSVAVTWVADGTIYTYHIDDTLPDNLLNPMRQAIAMITLHIACTAAGLKTDCLATARAALATTRHWHPATIHPYW